MADIGKKVKTSDNTPDAKKVKMAKLEGNETDIRRPLRGYEGWYEVSSEGALFSVTLQRFLKPGFNAARQTPELVFEYNNEEVRFSPGKAVAISFFSGAQRKCIAAEAFAIKEFKTMADLKSHPATNVLAKKYGVSHSAIFYILITALPKSNDANHDH